MYRKNMKRFLTKYKEVNLSAIAARYDELLK